MLKNAFRGTVCTWLDVKKFWGKERRNGFTRGAQL